MLTTSTMTEESVKHTFRLNEGNRAHNLDSIMTWFKPIWDRLGWGRPEFKSEESILQLTFGKAFQVKAMWILLRENTVFRPAVKNKKWTKSQEGALCNTLSCQSKMSWPQLFFSFCFFFCFASPLQSSSVASVSWIKVSMLFMLCNFVTCAWKYQKVDAGIFFCLHSCVCYIRLFYDWDI